MTDRHLAPRHLAFTALALVGLASTGCHKDSGPGKLFDEDGVWSLQSFDLNDGNGTLMIDHNARADGFLLKFDTKAGWVQTAMCGSAATEGPGDSFCTLNPTPSWFCHCFGYKFKADQMVWEEFQAGTTPPKPTFPMDGGGGGGATGTGGGTAGGGGDTVIFLNDVAGINGEYNFTPLPFGVFASDGVAASYTFLQEAPSVYDNVSCKPCSG